MLKFDESALYHCGKFSFTTILVVGRHNHGKYFSFILIYRTYLWYCCKREVPLLLTYGDMTVGSFLYNGSIIDPYTLFLPYKSQVAKMSELQEV